MQEVFPSYYHKFQCIADKCKNSCCIGWEIDIDEETMEIYKEIDGEMGDRIRKNICGNPPHFVLKDNRCPFLNEKGLCDIISCFGEDGLCDICYLHPRFQNEYDSFIETGLGICCEEAARIILSEKERVFIEKADNISDEEKEFLAERNKNLSLLQNREKTIKERLELLAEEYGLEFEFDLESIKKKYQVK